MSKFPLILEGNGLVVEANRLIRNSAGVGYIQGCCNEYLKKYNGPDLVPLPLIIDGFYGVKTEGVLNFIFVQHFISARTHPLPKVEFSYLDSMANLQVWYRTAKVLTDVDFEKSIYPDGDWGKETKAAFDNFFALADSLLERTKK